VDLVIDPGQRESGRLPAKIADGRLLSHALSS
jgi:hypothetical protein